MRLRWAVVQARTGLDRSQTSEMDERGDLQPLPDIAIGHLPLISDYHNSDAMHHYLSTGLSAPPGRLDSKARSYLLPKPICGESAGFALVQLHVTSWKAWRLSRNAARPAWRGARAASVPVH